MSCSASHERQPATVSSIRAATRSGAKGSGGGPSGGDHCKANPRRSPAMTANLARIVESSSEQSTPELKTIWFGPAERPSPAFGLAKQRLDQPVLRSRRQLQLELNLTGHTLHHAQQLMRSCHPELVMALTFGERHRVSQLHGPGLGGESRLDHQRARRRTGARLSTRRWA